MSKKLSELSWDKEVLWSEGIHGQVTSGAGVQLRVMYRLREKQETECSRSGRLSFGRVLDRY